MTFSFGKNWQKFIRNLTEDKFRSAEASLTEFLDPAGMQDKSFLDVGCGSGLFSHSAYKLGANKIISFDVDPYSVECCKYLHQKADAPKNWRVYKGSILDDNFISALGKFDIVYAWGVLHHTGKMWGAFKNSAKLVKKGGYYYIAIYNKVTGFAGSTFWLKIKKIYNQSPRIGKYALEMLYIMAYFIVNLIRLRTPLKNIKNYASNRGMDWKTDIIDWLGGYPYEFATVEEILNFMKENFQDFSLVNIKKTRGLGNNEYLFRRSES